MNTPVELLANDCLAHLQREDALLASLQVVVEDLRQSLLTRNTDQLGELAKRHSAIATQIEEISQDRGVLRRRMAATLAVPANDATVRLLTEQCDEETRVDLEDYRGRLKSTSAKLGTMLIANGNLTVQLLKLLENVFGTLSGTPVRSSSYERTGRPTVA